MSARRANALMTVLVALVVISAMGAELLRTLLVRQHSARQSLEQRQAQLLAESAVERAFVALRRSPDYRGETWPASQRPSCQAEIVVEEQTIVVTARVGEGQHRTTTRLSVVRGDKP
jgi:Tfp pilus assembly protein PilX